MSKVLLTVLVEGVKLDESDAPKQIFDAIQKPIMDELDKLSKQKGGSISVSGSTNSHGHTSVGVTGTWTW